MAFSSSCCESLGRTPGNKWRCCRVNYISWMFREKLVTSHLRQRAGFCGCVKSRVSLSFCTQWQAPKPFVVGLAASLGHIYPPHLLGANGRERWQAWWSFLSIYENEEATGICGGERFPKIGVKIAVLSVFEKLLRHELHCPGRGCLKHLFLVLLPY